MRRVDEAGEQRGAGALRRHGPLLAALVLLAVHFSSFDFRNLPIVTDARYYLYFAHQLNEGAVLHLDLFDNKTQLTSYVGALLFALGEGLALDPLLTIRAGYLGVTALGGLLSFFVFRRLGGGSGACGLLGVLAWCSFGFLGVMASLGNLPKLWMGIAALGTALLVDRGRWFWAGVAGALAFMDWQIGVVAWLGAFVSALVLSHDRGRRSALEVAAGGAAGLAPFVLYYAATGALGATVEQVIAASFFRGAEVAGNSDLPRRLNSLANATRIGIAEQQWLFYASWLGIPVVLAWLRARRELGLLLPLALYHFGVVAFSLFDFQWYGDYFLVVQSAAFFLGALWVAVYRALEPRIDPAPRARAIAALAACAIALGLARPGPLRPEIDLRRVKPAHDGATLGDQREVADALRARIGDGRVVFLDHSEMLFLMRKRNATPVIFWNRPTWSTHREPGESIIATARRIVLDADADFAVVPPPRRRSLAKDGTKERVIEFLDFSPVLEGYEIETFRSRNGRFEVALGVRKQREAVELDDERVEQLRALGYADVGEALPDDAAVGVVHHDPERAQPGLTLYTDAKACATHLMDMAGEIHHSWTRTPCYRWDNSVLLPNGDLLVSTRETKGAGRQEADAARFLLRLAWDGTVRWRVPLRVHHDADWTPRQQIVAMTHSFRRLPEVNESVPVRDHELTLLSPSGKTLDRLSLWDAIHAAEQPIPLQPVQPRRFEGSREIDLFHSNSVEWMRQPGLVGSHPLFRDDSVLVCIRNQDLLLLLDWSERRVIWSWGAGELSGPHDATLLPSGNILAFDNGLGRDWSRVIELDPRANRIVWEYRADEPQQFYSRTRGASQRLRNGNTLVTESEKGRVFELTPDGDTVWDFVNPSLSEEREPGVVVRARRLAGLDFGEVVRRVESREPLPLVD
jgi:hypothetical protein